MNGVLNPATIIRIVEQVSGLVELQYILQDPAAQIVARLRQNLASGKYAGLTEAQRLCDEVTGDMHAVHRDLHLMLRYNPEHFAQLSLPPEAQPSLDQHYWLKQLKYEHYGFTRIERLTGNIGYLELPKFAPVELAGETAVAAMRFLADMKALIIDLRKNGGGGPDIIQLLVSYLVSPEPVELSAIESRSHHTQFWTLPYVPGKRVPDMPVYVLTGSRTFSAAEAFAYDLQQMKRAVIVGEPTRGGAHPVTFTPVSDGFILEIPIARAVNPITHSNWEGTGVLPDIRVPASEALAAAHRHALTTLIERSGDDLERHILTWDMEIVAARYVPVPVDSRMLEAYTGSYGGGNWKVSLEHGALMMELSDFDGARVRDSLLPLSDTRFAAGEGQKIAFLRDEQGNVTSATMTYRFNEPALTLPRDKF